LYWINLESVNSGTNQRKFKHSKEEIELTKVVKIDQNCSKSEITVFVYSTATTSGQGLDKRQSTRKTWVKDAIKFNIQVFFVIAEPKHNENQKELESEALEYKDMIQFGFREDYYNLTLKSIAILRWAHIKCIDSKLIMKADDDLIVNVNQMVANLKSFRSGLTGVLREKDQPVRDFDSKWFMPKNIYPDEYYPNYLRGPAYVITRDAIKRFIETLDQYSSPVIVLEDVFITGLLAQRAGIQRHDSNKFSFHSGCRISVCFMFDLIVMFECETNDEKLDFWMRWKDTTPESCENFENHLPVIDILIVILLICFILFVIIRTRIVMISRRSLNKSIV
jgi:beta-1,3-galactosyltransferase 1